MFTVNGINAYFDSNRVNLMHPYFKGRFLVVSDPVVNLNSLYQKAPGSPSDVTTSEAEKRSITLSWSKPTPHGDAVEQYTVTKTVSILYRLVSYSELWLITYVWCKGGQGFRCTRGMNKCIFLPDRHIL